jgi:CheY-like chemotaxis protein
VPTAQPKVAVVGDKTFRPALGWRKGKAAKPGDLSRMGSPSLWQLLWHPVRSFVAQRRSVVQMMNKFLSPASFSTRADPMRGNLLINGYLTIMREDSVELVVTDQAMPKMTGTELAKVIKREWIIPVLLATGYADRVRSDDIGLPKLQSLTCSASLRTQ